MPGQAIVSIRDKQWGVSIANTPWECAQGLGGLTSLPANTGMLFDVGWEQPIPVTTEGMLFPLDITFLSDSLVVVDLVQDFVPGHRLTSVRPARYFLEVNAHEMDGIDLGDRAGIELLTPPPVPLQAPDWVQTMLSFMGFAIIVAFLVGIARSFIKSIFSSGEKKSLPPKKEGFLLKVRAAFPSMAVEIVNVKPKEVVDLYQLGFPGIYSGDSYFISTDDPAAAREMIIEAGIPAGRIRELPAMPYLPRTEPVVSLPPQTIEKKTLRLAAERRTVTAQTFKKWLRQGKAQPLQVGGYYGAEGPKPALYIVDDAIYQIEWRTYSHDLLPVGEKDLAEETRKRLREQGVKISGLGEKGKPAQPTSEEVTVDSWAERDRLGIWVTDEKTGETIAEWWDDEARQMFEEGFFAEPDYIRGQKLVGRKFEESVKNYLEGTGVLSSGSVDYLAQTKIAELNGLRIVKAYKQVSRHDKDKISVSLEAWGIFPGGKRPHMISMYRSGDKYIISPLYAHIRHWVEVPVPELKTWIRSLPIRHFEPMAVAPEYRERAEELARSVDEPIAILSLTTGQKALLEQMPAVIPAEAGPRRRQESDLEYLADSPEFLTQTVDATGYRGMLNTTFQEAIARAKGLTDIYKGFKEL